MTAAPKFLMIATEDLVESPLNPRKDFDSKKLAELAASVKEKGVLEPLLVRPTPDDRGGWEVAAGARRLRAAKAANLPTVPCLIREMTDTELLEVALLENVVRSDITPLEEGDTYRALVAAHGYSVEQLVKKTGKSRTVVFQRMKLADLKGVARDALAAGKVSASVAELLARLPTEKAQVEALAKLRKELHYRHAVVDDKDDISRMPFRDARDLLDEEFRLHLTKAPFDVKATDLTDAGACAACSKRTGADKEAFPDVKVDTCLDSVCWQKKASAATRLLKAEVAELGQTLVKVGRLTDQYDSSKLAQPLREKYSRPAEKVDGKHTWKALLGTETPIVVALDRENKTTTLVDKAKALELLEAKDAKKAAAVKKALETPTVDNWRQQQLEREKQNAEERLVRAVVEKKGLPVALKLPLPKVVGLLLGSFSGWDWSRLARRAGLPEKTKPSAVKPTQHVALLLAMALEYGRDAGAESLFAALATMAKLDVKQLRKKAASAEKGTCFVCGCTEEKARDGGCDWADEGQTACTSCLGEDE